MHTAEFSQKKEGVLSSTEMDMDIEATGLTETDLSQGDTHSLQNPTPVRPQSHGTHRTGWMGTSGWDGSMFYTNRSSV